MPVLFIRVSLQGSLVCLLEEVNRERKRIYIDGCRYNERLNDITE